MDKELELEVVAETETEMTLTIEGALVVIPARNIGCSSVKTVHGRVVPNWGGGFSLQVFFLTYANGNKSHYFGSIFPL